MYVLLFLLSSSVCSAGSGHAELPHLSSRIYSVQLEQDHCVILCVNDLVIAPTIDSSRVCTDRASNRATIQAFSPRADLELVQATYSYNETTGMGNICADGLIIPFYVNDITSHIKSSPAMHFSRSVAAGDRSLDNGGVTAHIYADYSINVTCESDGFQSVDPLPSVQEMPSPQDPFIHFHIDKTAGTKLRNLLYISARDLGLGNFIPCHGGVHCVVFSLDPTAEPPDVTAAADVAVVSGHFDWGMWDSLPSMLHYHMPPSSPDDSYSGLHCFAMLRHPVSRAVSYYYQRVYNPGHPIYGIKLNDMSLDHLRFIITLIRHPALLADNKTIVLSDEGMANAACRMLTNKRLSTGTVVVENQGSVLSELALSIEDRILAYGNAKQCVIGLQDDMQGSFRVLKHWFPWIKMNESEYMGKFNEGNRAGDVNELLTRDVIREIEKNNKCDLYLYNRGRERFKQQIRHLDSLETNA